MLRSYYITKKTFGCQCFVPRKFLKTIRFLQRRKCRTVDSGSYVFPLHVAGAVVRRIADICGTHVCGRSAFSRQAKSIAGFGAKNVQMLGFPHVACLRSSRKSETMRSPVMRHTAMPTAKHSRINGKRPIRMHSRNKYGRAYPGRFVRIKTVPAPAG